MKSSGVVVSFLLSENKRQEEGEMNCDAGGDVDLLFMSNEAPKSKSV